MVVSSWSTSETETACWGLNGGGYLTQRHITQDTARAFRLGFSPEGSNLAAKARATFEQVARENLDPLIPQEDLDYLWQLLKAV